MGREPIEILSDLDGILGSTKKHLMIYLEDLDRNPEDDAFWSDIMGLLDRLRGLEHISFILAIGHTPKTFDVLLRIAEHLEVVPNLARTRVTAAIKTFRELCQNEFPEDVDPVSSKWREERLGMPEGSVAEYYKLAELIYLDPARPVEAMSTLITTPRAFKAVLRRTWQAWASLHGEIDLDDMLVANVLRVNTPEGFAFINEHVGHIRRLCAEHKASSKEEKETREKIKSLWKIQTESAKWDGAAVDMLMDFLFPGWIDHSRRAEALQGVLRSDPTDYWIRLNAEKLLEGEIGDQRVIKAMQLWKKEPTGRVHGEMTFAEALLDVHSFAPKNRAVCRRFVGGAGDPFARFGFVRPHPETKGLAAATR
jgi:hypothetical protein